MTKSKSKAKKVTTIHVVSDGTGNLADHILNSVLTQFPDHSLLKVFHLVTPTMEIEKLVEGWKSANSMVLHAVISPEEKHRLDKACEKLRIPHFDLTGSLVQFISEHCGKSPVNERARLHRVDEGYFRRIQAMEFTAQHDDARRIDTAKEADIVIVGLSRVSKSPTSTFLGSLGYKVANISIARETGIPKEIEKIRKKIVVGLTMKPKRLMEIRTVRFKEFNRQIAANSEMAELPYTNLRQVVSEVAWAESEYRKRGYPIIDTTLQTIEETASAILAELRPAGGRRIR